MIKKVAKIRTFINNAWTETPWFRAAGIIGTTAAGLMFLNVILPSELAIDFSTIDPKMDQIIITSIIILYFFLVSIFSGDRLKFEQKLRALELSFRYDNRGTLYNGNEPNIAFRIATFKGILEGISGAIGSEKLKDLLINTGRLAGNDFAMSLKDIYNKDIASQKAISIWDELSLIEKLDQWAEYDSSTGWGILACSLKTNSVTVVINHLQGLFVGNAGLLFGYFLGGYSETILSTIIYDHLNGKYEEYSEAILLTTNQSDKYTLELEYQLK